MDKCPICQRNIPAPEREGQVYQVRCYACGCFQISDKASRIELHSNPKRYVLQGLARQYTEARLDPLLISVQNVDELLQRATPEFADQLDNILLYTKTKSDRLGAWILLKNDVDYPIAYAKDQAEFGYMLDILEKSFGHLERMGDERYRLNYTGWQRVHQLARKPQVTNQCFVAMSFSSELKSAYIEGIAPGIEATGYKPYRVDQHQHNEKICDHIIAEIRRSRLMVADFTGQKGGVYFEAGFGLGLGLPVIWTCRADDVNSLHFDTRQYNHILWETPADLLTKLRDRIRATVAPDNSDQ
jgi:hypothetical protein